MLTLTGLYLLYSDSFYLSLIPFGLSSLCRSNGLLNLGYLLYFIIRAFVSRGRFNVVTLTVTGSRIILAVISVISGFCVYQYYVYLILCKRNKFNIEESVPKVIRTYAANRYKLVADFAVESWCLKKIPLSYRLTFIYLTSLD